MACDNLSHNSFLHNNDLNVTGACLDVDFSRNELVTLHASPSFWKFAFDKNCNRIIQVEKPFDTSEYEATTLVRMAYKAFELQFPFEFGCIDPTVGTLAMSQKVKFDKVIRHEHCNNTHIPSAIRQTNTYIFPQLTSSKTNWPI